MFHTNRLQRGGYCPDDPYAMRQRQRNGRLNDDVGSMAKRAIGLNSLTANVRMPDLHDRGTNDKCAAEKTKCHPERMTCPLIGAAT